MQVIVHQSINHISPAHWDNYLEGHCPFNRYQFHQAMEVSGCTSGDTGWRPMHIEIVDDQQPLALIPGYLKTNSWGEYVFDYAWADAYQRYGLAYYPKLIAAIPYTPCAGPRIHLATEVDLTTILTFLESQMPALSEQYGFSSWHWLFAQQQDWQTADNTRWHRRLGCQYHWYNHGYNDFDGFLSTLTSRKRKMLRKERKQIAATGIEFTWLEGKDINDQDLGHFYKCYANTYYVRGRPPYLNLELFRMLVANMPEQIVLLRAQYPNQQQPLAYAWYFKDQDTLYGRYWGCFEEVPLLHFETCYYQGIDYCIAHGLQHFDAGAQGEHKLARGFIPQATQSYHWLQVNEFNPAIAQFCQQETKQVSEYMHWADQQIPYRDKGDMT